MFQEWTDPFDIDQMYSGLPEALKDIGSVPSNNLYMGRKPEPKKAEAPIVQPVVETTPPLKSPFEVVPNSIFSDGHPVGSQPKYNVLKSKEGFDGCKAGMYIEWSILVIVGLGFFILFLMYIQSRSRLCQTEQLLHIITMMAKPNVAQSV